MSPCVFYTICGLTTLLGHWAVRRSAALAVITGTLLATLCGILLSFVSGGAYPAFVWPPSLPSLLLHIGVFFVVASLTGIPFYVVRHWEAEAGTGADSDGPGRE